MRELYYYSERMVSEKNENDMEFSPKADPAQYERYTHRSRTAKEIIAEMPEEELEEVY